MRQIFKSIDTDNSGAISLNEMHEFMQDETLRLQDAITTSKGNALLQCRGLFFLWFAHAPDR